MGGMTLQEKLFSFRGRVTRLDYWLFHLAWFGAMAVLGVFLIVSGVFVREGNALLPWVVVTIAGLAYLASIWPYLAISIKRCHDRNKSGWWMLLWIGLSLIPYVGVLAGLWCLVELGFLDGTQGPNRFGPSPKGLGGDLVAEAFT